MSIQLILFTTASCIAFYLYFWSESLQIFPTAKVRLLSHKAMPVHYFINYYTNIISEFVCQVNESVS